MRLVTVALATAFTLAACSSPSPVKYPAGNTKNLPFEAPPQGPFQPNVNLFVCNMSVSNRPNSAADGQVIEYNPIIVAFGTVLAAAPANDVCLSSGFGPRNGRMHKGIDLFARPAGTVYSGAPGTILEVTQQTGFGNQVLIDHGGGVYTRYAHLESFAPALAAGQRVGFGEPIGRMGKSGNATGIHLHYEILTGDYNTPRKSWGMKAHNPLDFPAYTGFNSGS
ncbi:MAG: M23 family metallopeptidase [Henriciella sp.]|jgi:murein DD-endopeptidase MepM/ murein hydrolase activator NlpD